jgi:Asp-tRNA(Asn)/Glu-tRNA(Gln) amidotransferase A subunit family amidase
VIYSAPSLPALTVSSGPICRNVRDAAIALAVMSGPDGRDFACIKTDPPDLLATIDDGVDGMSMAWSDDLGYAQHYLQPESAGVVSAVREAALGLRSLGATVEPLPPICDDFWDDYVVTNYLFQIAMDVAEPPMDRFLEALNARHKTSSAFREVFAGHDLLLSPTLQLLAPTIDDWSRAWLREGESYRHETFVPTYTCFTHIFNWIAFPAASVPCGFVDGLPIGLQIIGPPGAEDKILRAASAFQSAFPETIARPPID